MALLFGNLTSQKYRESGVFPELETAHVAAVVRWWQGTNANGSSSALPFGNLPRPIVAGVNSPTWSLVYILHDFTPEKTFLTTE